MNVTQRLQNEGVEICSFARDRQLKEISCSGEELAYAPHQDQPTWGSWPVQVVFSALTSELTWGKKRRYYRQNSVFRVVQILLQSVKRYAFGKELAYAPHQDCTYGQFPCVWLISHDTTRAQYWGETLTFCVPVLSDHHKPTNGTQT